MEALKIADALWMVANMAFALLLGWLVGYERYARGRAAGSQVYCLVCATSCAVTLLAGHPMAWLGAGSREAFADPTRVTGAILTGIGFLGAGIIMQTGTSVRGLTTAALIWGSSAIGILVGAAFYLPAIGLTALFVASVAIIPRIERRLPARVALAATFRFKEGYVPDPGAVHHFLTERGLSIPQDGVSLGLAKGCFEIECIIYCEAATRNATMNRIAVEMSGMEHLDSFAMAPSSRA